MHLNTLLGPACLPTITTTSLASPTSSPSEDLVPRACITKTPDVLLYYDKKNSTLGTPGGTVRMKRTGRTVTNTIHTGFTFNNIPAGSTGCMLQFELPPVTKPNQYAMGANNCDLFGVDKPVTYATNWNNQPKRRRTGR